MDGLIDGNNGEGEADEPGADVRKGPEKGEDDGVSSKVRWNMDEMDWRLKKHTDCIQQNTSNISSHVHTRKVACVAVSMTANLQPRSDVDR